MTAKEKKIHFNTTSKMTYNQKYHFILGLGIGLPDIPWFCLTFGRPRPLTGSAPGPADELERPG